MGLNFCLLCTVTGIRTEENYKIITLENGEQINTRAVVVTTGVDYRRLPADGVDNYTGAGVYYGAAMTEAHACRNKKVFIVGGGNSAGQGAVYLSQFAEKVTILIRRDDLTSSMSSYLIDQIDQIENIEVVGQREITEAQGDGHLEQLTIKNRTTGECYSEQADALFVFIGARPYTEWLEQYLLRNPRGYLLTGRDVVLNDDYNRFWKKDREPFLLETCEPGIFAAGDVRSGAMNRVASAVGEGAMAIKFVHEYLAEV